jgi:outer membrane protein W
MKTRFSGVLTALAIGGALAASAPAHAEAYVVVKGGPYFPTATNAIDAINQVSLKWPTAYAVDLGFGGYWGIFGLQLSGGYRTTGSNDLDVHTFPIILLARARLPLGFVAPYLEAGAGAAISTASFDKVIQGASSSTKTALELQGGAGVDFYLGPLILGAELKYVWLNPTFTISGTGASNPTQQLNMSGITIQAYIGYMW